MTAPTGQASQQESGGRPPANAELSTSWNRAFRIILITCGSLSFAWSLAIGTAILNPAAMPHSFLPGCSSKTEFAVEGSPAGGSPTGSRAEEPTQSVKMTRECQRPEIPATHLIAAAALTAFFFIGIVAPLVGPIVVKTPFGEYQGAALSASDPPSALAAAAANATDAAARGFL